jgi:HAD superfamily hydrolase (TIGR01484 family)
MNKLFLFDVDGTIVESGQKITDETSNILNEIKKNGYEIGIVGGGKLDKILEQMDNKIYFNHYFTECGCVYYKNNLSESNDLVEIYKRNIRNHPLYKDINILIKYCLKYLSNVDYTITGNFIDLRNGIIYVSLIGLNATYEERTYFIELDNKCNYRKNLIETLKYITYKLNISNKIDIVEGGSVGIAIYPSEYDKVQVLDMFNTKDYDIIYYFGDKCEPNGNDYKILNDNRLIGISVNNYKDTINELLNILNIK